jgi:hypothetical protein
MSKLHKYIDLSTGKKNLISEAESLRRGQL